MLSFTQTEISGVFVVDISPIADERGLFARQWCSDEFRQHGLNPGLVQINVAFNPHRGTVRGMHYQSAPHAEAKLVRCTRGSIFDVAVDLRPDSETYLSWVGAELSAESRRMLYVPEGCAHGYQTLEPNTEMQYQTSATYSRDAAAGVPFDDPTLEIGWPLRVSLVSDQDRSWPRISSERTRSQRSPDPATRRE